MTLTPMVWMSMGFQILIVAFFSYLAWSYLLKQYLAARLGVLVFMTPLFGVLFSVVLLGESIGLPFVCGSLLVLAGLLMMQSKNLKIVSRRNRGGAVPVTASCAQDR